MVEISIVMPVYNGADYICEAIQSILEQSFTNYELIILDDGSTDQTVEIIRRFHDPRIVLYTQPHDFIKSLNHGLEKAIGKYIARMDADDIMHPERLKIQYNIMEVEPSIDFCGSWYTLFGEKMKDKKVVPIYSGRVDTPLLTLLVKNVFCHPTMMMRKCFLEKHDLNYQNYSYAEDYKLWVEAAKCGACFYVEPQSLLYYRVSDTQICHTKRPEQRESSLRIKDELIDYILSCFEKNSQAKDYYRILQRLEQEEQIDYDMKVNHMCHLFDYNKSSINVPV